jgi:geranylgeranyl diphosphate synthase type II
MDNDSLRHGRPTVHLAFDEATAILVGDGLLTLAFEKVSSSVELTDDQKVRAIFLLASHAGNNGMILGQHFDLLYEKKIPDGTQLERISRLKTGMLLSAAFQLGALICQPQDQEKWAQIGHDLGLLFQIQDDVLEATTSIDNMGKSKSDEALEKATFVKILGLEQCQKKMESLKEKIIRERASIQLKHTTILDLIDTILTRQY